MSPKKAAKPVDDEEDEEIEEEDDTPQEESFKCRVCGKTVDVDEGDDLIDVCDNCSANYDMEKLWDDFDEGKVPEDQLKKVDLSKYVLKKAPAKKAAKKK